MTRVAVIGADGRMGSAVCAAVEAAEDLQLVARIDAADSLEDALDAGADVAVEFTTPDSVKANAAWLLERGVHVVVGATGLTDDDLADLERATGPANLFVAPNFAIGAVLLMQLAAQVAAHLPHVEITELHHDRKVDAPSGTALRTAKLIADARGDAPEVPGPNGHPARGDVVDGVPIHSVRLPGLVASQEVVFGGEGQTLSIRHDSIDRSSFMPGVVLAVRRVAGLPGLTVGLEHLLR
jgi:4-hydroxy-tetrahydrodipicolinate reductase